MMQVNHRRLVPSAAVWLAALTLLPAPAALHAQGGQDVMRWVVAPQENEARYLVREQLASLNFPNDAVGRTSAVTGGIVVAADGTVVAGESRFVIDMTTLQTDNDRRDNFIRRNTLQTADHPTVTFVPMSFTGLSFPLPDSGAVQFRMMGDLTVRGVTRPVTWEVMARLVNGALRGEARTQFTFAEFEMTKPRVASVLSVADDIRLEYSFFLVPAR
jgi:polyisoprenoid-binding protein YceI